MTQIFVSYRRNDTREVAGRVIDRLHSEFGPQSVVFDIISVPFGADFRQHLTTAIHNCLALLALIGRRWTGVQPGRLPRIKGSDDFVRAELETALAVGTYVVPVLVDSAPMPRTDQLPPPLTPLAMLNAAPLDSGRDFHSHMNRVISRLKELGAVQHDPHAELHVVNLHRTTDDLGFPVLNFTIANRTSRSQIINRLECEIIEYHPYASIPKTRVLTPIDVWEVTLPYSEGTFEFRPTSPVLLDSDDAATVGLRFQCIYQGQPIPPRSTAGYRMRVRFLSDRGLSAQSEPFSL